MNSWGKDWGEEGYCYMRFEDFARYTKYGFGMVPDITRSLNFTDETVQLGGNSFLKSYLLKMDNMFSRPPILCLKMEFTI
ncbi:MAG: hypothetical protein HWD58_03995 [Bacteroidota bacterium]|nr:MAG: hypothetical protein HWD58_03995 [Bacteroidota bacterium]